MAYLGNQPSNNFVSLKRQVITGNGGSTYTLNHSVASVNDVAIFVNNVRQDPASYSISGTALTLGGTISSSDSCYVIFLGQALQTVTPDADTITTAMLKSNSVTSAKMFSSFANGITMADHWRLTASTNSGTSATIATNWERVDDNCFEKIGTGMTESSGIFSFPSTGKYLVTEFWTVNGANGDLFRITGNITIDNSNFVTRTDTIVSGAVAYKAFGNQYLVDVTDISNVKIRFDTGSFASGTVLIGSTDDNRSSVSFLRIGDT